MKKRSIIPLLFLIFAIPNLYSQMFILNEDFSSAEGTTPPLEWSSILLNGSPQDEWHFDNPGNQTIGFPITTPFAIFDASYYSNNSQPEEVALETTFFDASVSNYIMLEFDHKFIEGNGSICKIQANNGNSWVDVATYSSSINTVSHEIVDISGICGGVTNAKLRFIWSGNGSGYWAIDNVTIYGALPVDAGISKINNPAPPFNTGLQAVEVSLKNYGYNILSNAEIHWSVNGTIQPTYNWNGSLSYGQSQTNIEIGTYDFQESTLLKIWPENPNNQQDPNPFNDTITKVLYPALCGTYTIGGSNPDFENFTDAINVLEKAGVTCAVKFLVRDGEYTEQLFIHEVAGASNDNSITFESQSGDSTTVIINKIYPEISVSLINTKFINFHKIGFKGYFGLLIDKSSSHINVSNCYFEGGQWGINVQDGSNNVNIVKNNFVIQNYFSVLLQSAKDIVIENNSVNTNRTGFNLNNSLNVQIKNNKIKITGIEFFNNDHNSGIYTNNSDTINIFNNYISTSGLYHTEGIYLYNSYNYNIYFNSIYINSTDVGENSKGIWIRGGDYCSFKNNILSTDINSRLTVISGSLQEFVFDNNDYHCPNGIVGNIEGKDYQKLNEWQNAIQQDYNSLDENPFYTSDIDLSTNQVLLNNIGLPIDGIEYDIDGTLRNVSAPDLGAKEYNPCQLDAGINRITEPNNPLTQGEHEIKVILQNQGSDNLSSATINWKVNDILQTPVNWTGNLSMNENEEVSIGIYEFEGGLYNLNIWTTLPSGSVDCNSYNDTIHEQRAVSLCGNYTIGGTNPDFESFTDAVNVLSIAGVTCPVTFKVRDGEYYEQFLIKNILGASNQNIITFESESGDSTLVTVRHEENENATVVLKRAQYINFKGIGFIGYTGITIQDTSKYINVENCYFSQGVIGGYVISGSSDINIANNTFTSTNHGFILQGERIYVENNKFLDLWYSAITMNSSRNVLVDKNYVNTKRSAFNLNSCNKIDITNNRIKINGIEFFNSNHNSGVYAQDCDTINIYNNYILTEGINKSEGINFYNSNNCDIYFNSLFVNNTDIGQQSISISLKGGNQNILKDNILNIKHGGIPIYITENAQLYTIDYNDYYSPNDLIGRLGNNDYYDLNDWRQAINGDANSKNVNPFYSSDDNLAMNQILLNNVGIPISDINLDIDGNLRNPTNPDIGAKEYNPCQPDAGINRITEPNNPLTQGEHEIKVILQNQGSDNLSSATINWKVNDILQTPVNWTGNLSVNENEEVSLGIYEFEGGLYNLNIWTTLPNGSVDCNYYNDTIHEQRAVSLCGNYTIGGTNPDFKNFTEAVSVLKTAGVSCPVIFNVRDGEYIEQIGINNIAGASDTNTITFQSESGDSTSAIIKFDGNENYTTVSLNNASFINFNKLGFNGANCIMIDNNSNNIKIENCYIKGIDWVTGVGVRSGSHDIIIKNNYFLEGVQGLEFSQGVNVGNNARTKNCMVYNNTFQNQILAGINCDQAINIKFDNNKINSNYAGIIFRGTNRSEITNNKINVLSGNGWRNGGIYISNCDTNYIYNNFIVCDGTFPSTGIYLENSYHEKIYFNSINILNSDIGQQSISISLKGGNQNILKDNILNIKHNGSPISISQDAQSYTLDYNDYYSPNDLIGRLGNNDYYDLNDWGQAINGDANSKNVNPFFADENNPLPYQRELNGGGIPVSGILLDINGLIRNDQAPDIGCVEFMVDFGVTDLISPSLDCFHSGTESVTVYLRQFGDIPFVDLKLAYQVNGGVVHNDIIPGTIDNDLEFTFDTDVDISTDGEYNFKIWLINTLDDNINNDTLYVTRYSKPSPQITSSYNNDCSWKEVSFSGNAQIEDPYYIDGYEWLFGDDKISNQQNPIHIYDDVGTYNAIFRAYSNAGCYSDDTLNVFIDPNYEPLGLQMDINNEVCKGDGTGLVVLNASGGTPPYTYYLNNNSLSNNQITDLSPGEYFFSVSDIQQCELNDTVVIKPSIYMNPQILPSIDSGFAPLEVYFDLNSIDVATYLWDFGEGENSIEENPTHYFNGYGEHQVVLTANSGEPYYCLEYDTVIIFVDENIIIKANTVFTPNNDGLNDYFEVRTNGIKDLFVSIYDRQGKKINEIQSVDEKWDGNTMSGDEAPDGTYFYYIDATGFNTLKYHKEGSVLLLRAYAEVTPNPVISSLRIKPFGLTDGEITLEIYNLLGNKLISLVPENKDEISIDVSGLENGIYIINICDNSNCISKRFVKSNY